MSKGICLFIESYDGELEPTVSELMRVAHEIKEKTNEPIQGILLSHKCDQLLSQISTIGFDEIYAFSTSVSCEYKDDVLTSCVAEMIERVNPSSLLIPATPSARSLFSRVAIRIGAGLTADCSALEVAEDEKGTYLKQVKPSFTQDDMVRIITKRENFPQMVTIKQGVFAPLEKNDYPKAEVTFFEDISVPDSQLEVIEISETEQKGDSIAAAEIVIVAGRGALAEDNLDRLRQFAKTINGVIGGTRPLADEGIIAFEDQIGQTGITIRPKICLTFGVSGAIQHTEGLRDIELFIAVNKDENAPIFNVADYGVIGKMEEILDHLL